MNQIISEAARIRYRSNGTYGCPIVIRAPFGAGVFLAPRLLEALGVDVIPINVTPNGLFPRAAEPLPENLGALCETVRANHCDIGFAQDMDADRLAVVSERGEPIGEDYTLVLAAWHVLSRTPGPVVAVGS